MDKGSYTFSALEQKYGNFMAPAFDITVGSKQLDSSKIPISELTVDISAGYEAGGCSFTIQSMYDYENSKFDQSLLDTIKVGEKLSIKAGYVTKTLVFEGYVDEFTVRYEDGAPTITVVGIDAKGYLMNANTQMYLNQKTIADAVRSILNTCVSKGFASKITLGTITKMEAELIQNDINDYQFLTYIAELQGLQFFVVAGEIVFDNVYSNTKSLITLDWGSSLFGFSKTLSLAGQVGKVTVYSIDPKTGKQIKGEASSTGLSGSGNTAWQTASAFSTVEEVEYNYLVQTEAECKKLAEARLDARAINYVSGEGRCIGIPELIPGRYITVSGFDNKTNGSYFISSVRHEYSGEGYFTTFRVKGAKSK